MDFDQFWASQPRFDPFPPEGTPVPIPWCAPSQALADWCLHLVDTLCQDPVPTKVDYAKARLLDNFARSVLKASGEHQAHTTDQHPCFLQVLHDRLGRTGKRAAAPRHSRTAPAGTGTSGADRGHLP